MTIRLSRALPVSRVVYEAVSTLQQAGFETYVVGGAVRDHLLDRTPKDYDLSSAATPEEIREVFGRRRARLIGKRFRLVHLVYRKDDGRNDVLEISTFRSAPAKDSRHQLVSSDNAYGTVTEDAMRRDFTVNALFYDPVKEQIIDFTGMGLKDIENKVVRAIGDPEERFCEDPVRLLRALKLVGQYDFSLESKTENALFKTLPKIREASDSRLSLELEKILLSSYGDKHLVAFHDYGFLAYFLPAFDAVWNRAQMKYAMQLLAERNFRIEENEYRRSLSMAIAALSYPFVRDLRDDELFAAVKNLFKPENLINRAADSTVRIIKMQRKLEKKERRTEIISRQGYSHARELLIIRSKFEQIPPEIIDYWPPGGRESSGSGRRRGGKKPSGKWRRREEKNTEAVKRELNE